MRKREIHSVAHWAMMFLLLMFPLLMVGISTFGKDETQVVIQYKYESNEINTNNDVVNNNIYHIKDDFQLESFMHNKSGTASIDFYFIQGDIEFTYNDSSLYNDENFFYSKTSYSFSFDTTVNLSQIYLMNGLIGQYDLTDITFSDCLVQITNIEFSNDCTLEFNELLEYTNYNEIDGVDVSQSNYKQEVNYWVDGFLNLPINSWYKSLMNVIGVGFTNSTVMNVIYVMPVYILWVFIFDVIVDCFLVIIKLPHKLLNRLSGGENE